MGDKTWGPVTWGYTRHVIWSNQSSFIELVLVNHMVCDVSGWNQALQNKPLMSSDIS